jgi:2-polyprenyl-3-methyl-5-hydroxy-6-metoxy-1,4-benzoquinol methylase
MEKISFVSCINDFDLYRECVERSLNNQTSNIEIELVPIDNTNSEWSCPSALNRGLEKATGEIVVFCHQDIIFPSSWVDNLCSQIYLVEKSCKEWGVLGLFGITLCGSYSGHVIDLQGHSRFMPLPQKAQSLDELCLIIKKNSGLKFDERLGGFHFYGGDLCLEAEVKGFTNFAIDACVKHLGQGKSGADFRRMARRLSNKWRHRNSPRRVLITTCAFVRVQKGLKSWIQTNLLWLNFKLRHMFPLFFPLSDNRRNNLSADVDNKTIGLLPQYYEWIRYDILDVVPSSAKHILSIGCGGGITEAIMTRRGVKVVGVEMNPEAARIARQRGLTILEGDASEIDVSVAGELYDCIIYGDVLEHIPDPLSVLQRHIASLKKNGTVIVSVPNFRHYSVLWQLFIGGHVRYVDGGILDRTHLRITTRKMVFEWFELAGLRKTFLKYVIWGRRYRLISAVSLGLLREFLASQILAVGRKD